jgi:hypothetical protein
VKSEEFIREVDEELQRERIAKLWQRYGGLLVGLALLLVLGTAAKVAWDHWRQRAMAAEALRFAAAEQALTGAKPAEAADQFAALAAEGDTGYAALARLREAQARIDLKDEAGADKALEALAGGGDDAVLRELGTLLAVSHEIDRGDPAALAQKLEPLARDEAAWRYRARELLAVLAIRTGDLDKARKLLEPLSREVGVPQTQQRRAQELLEAVGGPAQQASS